MAIYIGWSHFKSAKAGLQSQPARRTISIWSRQNQNFNSAQADSKSAQAGSQSHYDTRRILIWSRRNQNLNSA
jgi:hypothetical protein